MTALDKLADRRGSAVLWFHPSRIKVKEGLNARDMTSPDNMEHVRELAESIFVNGVRTPLTISRDDDDTVFVVSGHCRLAACMLLLEQGRWEGEIKCLPEANFTNDIDRRLEQSVDNSGKPLTAMEEGVNFKMAVAKGMTIAAICKKTGYSKTHVHNCLNLQGVPIEVQNMVRDGTVSASLAGEVTRKQTDAGAVKTLTEAVEKAKEAAAPGEKIKVTKKHVEESTGTQFDLRKTRIRRAGKTALKVRIHRVDYVFPLKDWEHLANRILDLAAEDVTKAEAAPVASTDEAETPPEEVSQAAE